MSKAYPRENQTSYSVDDNSEGSMTDPIMSLSNSSEEDFSEEEFQPTGNWKIDLYKASKKQDNELADKALRGVSQGKIDSFLHKVSNEDNLAAERFTDRVKQYKSSGKFPVKKPVQESQPETNIQNNTAIDDSHSSYDDTVMGDVND